MEMNNNDLIEMISPKYTLAKNLTDIKGKTYMLMKNGSHVVCPFLSTSNAMVACSSACAKFRVIAERKKENTSELTGRVIVNLCCGSGMSVIAEEIEIKRQENNINPNMKKT
jgi:hypothetical protein